MDQALRPYQEKAIESVFDQWNEVKNTLLVMATGTGKTVVMAKIIEELVHNGKKVLLLAHRGELLEQAQSKIKSFTGLDSQLEKAESTSNESCPVVVGSVQSIQHGRLEAMNPKRFDVILIDECHHAVSTTYQNILDHFRCANVLGVTATADRSDRKNLSRVFDSIAFQYDLRQAVKDGFLARPKALTIPLGIDLSGVKVTAGDFQADDLGHALEPYLERIADEMTKICKGRKTIVFLPLISTSQKFCRILRQKGLKACEVNGQSKDREQILKDFESGKYEVLTNAMLLTEGFDCPAIDTVVVLRPTKSRALYAQAVGRASRLAPGKTEFLILDFLWMTEKHSLCRPAYLLADTEETAIRATSKIAASGSETDLLESVETAKKDIASERESKLAKTLASKAKKKRQFVDPLQYEVSTGNLDLMDYEPSFSWERESITFGQIQALENFGVDAGGLNRGEASRILDSLIDRAKQGLSTAKQIRFLEERGFKHVANWSKDDASKMITLISSNNWNVPYHIKPESYQPR